MIMSAVVNPLDVIKVRLQLQNQLQRVVKNTADASTITSSNQGLNPGGMGESHVSHRNLAYQGLRQAASKIVQEEGYAGLLKGMTPSMLREASYSSIRIGLYDYVKDRIAPGKTKEEFTLLEKLLAGMISGALGSSLANPTDLVKIRFQSATVESPTPYRHTLNAFSTIYKKEGGIKGLYKGVGPTTMRAATLTGSQLASYDHSKRYLLRTQYFNDNPTTHLIASIISGLVTTTCTNPFDVIKTRIMADKNLYSSPLDCFIKTLRKEGPFSFMKGWWPNYFRLGPHFIVSIPLAEFIRKQLGAETL